MFFKQFSCFSCGTHKYNNPNFDVAGITDVKLWILNHLLNVDIPFIIKKIYLCKKHKNEFDKYQKNKEYE
jgi:hypothetical protein